MTYIIFDHKRSDGYGKEVYLPGTMMWNPSNRSVSGNPPMGVSVQLGGPVTVEVQATDDNFYWEVVESVSTSGGTFLTYKRCVMVPISDEPINYVDLPEVDFSKPYPGQNSEAFYSESEELEDSTVSE